TSVTRLHATYLSCTSPAHTEISTLSLHDALPIYCLCRQPFLKSNYVGVTHDDQFVQLRFPRFHWIALRDQIFQALPPGHDCQSRSEEHTSELQSLAYLVCRLLLEKKKTPSDTLAQ